MNLALECYVLLNVPARQSRNYYEFLSANLPDDALVYVDALFGGLDVCARLKCATSSQAKFVVDEISSLVSKKVDTTEAALVEISGFHQNESGITEENFMLVAVRSRSDMADESHQRSFLKFLSRNGVLIKLRYAGVVAGVDSINDLKIPESIFEIDEKFSDGRTMILEFSIVGLDDPREIIMKKLQQYSEISSSRTFFAVNFAKTDPAGTMSRVRAAARSSKGLIDYLKSLRSLLGI